MIYKMTLKDSTDEMTFNLLEVPIVDKDIEGAVDNVTLDGNQYTDYLYLKKQYIQKWSIMCDEEYERLRGFYTRQFDEAEIPTYELYYGETIYNAYTLSGDYILADVQGVEPARMSLAQLNGNATQTTYSGKNLLENKNHTRTYLGITFTKHDDGSFTLNGTSTGNAQFYLTYDGVGYHAPSLELPAGTYTMNGRDSGGVKFECNYEVEGVSGSRYSTGTFTATAPIKCGIYITIANGATVNNLTIYPQLEAGSTATSYEQYVGGIPAPNPSYPQPISVVTGEQAVKVTGKNLFDKDGVTILNAYISGANVITAQPQNRTAIVPLQPNTTYTLSGTRSKIPDTATDDFIALLVSSSTEPAIGSSGRRVGVTTDLNMNFTFTTDSTENWLALKVANTANSNFDETMATIQLELGTQATSYEAFTAQEFSIDLGSIELAKIGTYQDRIYKDGEKWYVEKQVGKTMFDGSQSFTYFRDATTFVTANYTSSVILRLPSNTVTTMSDKLIGATLGQTYGGSVIYGVSQASNGQYLQVSLKPEDASDADGVKTFFSTHPTTVYYALATPTTTEITNQTLIDQLEALVNVSIATGIHNIFTEVASGNLNPTMILNFIEVVSQRVTLVPETPVRLTLTDGGVINACGCRKDVQLTMRETVE